MTEKPVHNPKDIVGNTKLPLHLVPATSMAHMSLALLDGGLKYGFWNWRAAGINASVYADAAIRHIEKWKEGENLDGDSELSHIAHALATLAIIVDAAACGKLNDDRAPGIGISTYLDALTHHVSRLKHKHVGKNPRHYTILDTQEIVGRNTLDSRENVGEKLGARQGVFSAPSQ